MYRLHGDGVQEREDYLSPLTFVVDADGLGDGDLQCDLLEVRASLSHSMRAFSGR